jgi:hypothetical protein
MTFKTTKIILQFLNYFISGYELNNYMLHSQGYIQGEFLNMLTTFLCLNYVYTQILIFS